VQLIITDAWIAKSRAIHLTGMQLVAAFVAAASVLMLLSLGMYHWVFLKGAREGWPVIGALVNVVTREDLAQRERYVRANLDLLARRLGEMQVKLTQLESLGQRVSVLAGVPAPAASAPAGAGGALVAPQPLSIEQLQSVMVGLEQATHQRTESFMVLESELFDLKMRRILIPTQKPVSDADVGSPFGWRVDPITGAAALHTGLDFPGATGTPILAAAGGIVVIQQFHPEYGNVVEIDHGNGLITRFAHASRVWVKNGDLVKRGQKIADVGTSGRATGPHLHFEVWVDGVPQDPKKFLDAGEHLTLASAQPSNRRSTGSPAPMVMPRPGAGQK